MKNNILFWIIFTVSCNGLNKYNMLNYNNKYNNILHKNDEIAKLCFNELYNATLENVNQRMVHLADNPNDLNPEMQLSFDAYYKNKEAYLYIRTGLDLLSMHYNGNTEVHNLIAQIAFHTFKTMLHYADNVQIEQLEFPIVRPVLREDQHTLFEAHASNSHNRLFDVRLFDVRDHDSLFGWMIQFCDVETLKFLVNNQDKLCEVYGKERIYSVDMLSCMLCRYVADRIHKRSMHEETQMCALIIELMHSIPYADYAQHLQQELAEHKYQDKILLTTLQDIVERYREIPRDQSGVRESNIEIKHTTETINKLLEIFSRLHRQNANLFTNKIKHIVVNIVENGNVHMVKAALNLPKKRYRSTEIHKFLEIPKNKAAALKEGEKEVSSKQEQEKATRSQKDLEATIKFLSLEEGIAKNREELKEKLGLGYKWFKIAGIDIERSFYNMNHEAELKAILDETARLCNQSMEPSLIPDIKQEKTFFETYF